MLAGFPWKSIVILAPIVGLVVLGLVIALRSGAANLSTHQGTARFVSNLWQLLLRLVGWAVGIFAVQQLMGAPSVLSW